MATFGKTDVGADKWGAIAGDKLACRFQAPASGTITSITWHCEVYTGDAVKAAVYSDNSGAPDALLGSGETTGISDGVNDVTVTLSVSITSGNYYWLVVKSDFTYPYYFWDSGASNQEAQLAEAYASAFSDPFGTPDISYAHEVSIYATYTPSAGVSVPVMVHHLKNQGIM